MSFSKLSAVDIVKSLKEGKYTCEEVVNSFIEQINKNEKQVEVGNFLIKNKKDLQQCLIKKTRY